MIAYVFSTASAQLLVDVDLGPWLRVLVSGDVAAFKGGDFDFDQGASIALFAETCPSMSCAEGSISHRICDPSGYCMSSGFNRWVARTQFATSRRGAPTSSESEIVLLTF